MSLNTHNFRPAINLLQNNQNAGHALRLERSQVSLQRCFLNCTDSEIYRSLPIRKFIFKQFFKENCNANTENIFLHLFFLHMIIVECNFDCIKRFKIANQKQTLIIVLL